MGGRTSCCVNLIILGLDGELGEGASELCVRGEGAEKEIDSTNRQCFAWQHEVAIHHITACMRNRQPADVGKTDFAWRCRLAIALLRLQPVPPLPAVHSVPCCRWCSRWCMWWTPRTLT